MADVVVPERLRAVHRAEVRRDLSAGRGRVLDQRLELPALRHDGTELSVELTITAFEAAGQTWTTGWIRDWPELRAERAARVSLEQVSERLAQQNRSLAGRADVARCATMCAFVAALRAAGSATKPLPARYRAAPRWYDAALHTGRKAWEMTQHVSGDDPGDWDTATASPERYVDADDHLAAKLRLLGEHPANTACANVHAHVLARTARHWAQFGTSTYAEALEVERETATEPSPTADRTAECMPVMV